MLNNSCGELVCQKGFNLILFSYKIAVSGSGVGGRGAQIQGLGRGVEGLRFGSGVIGGWGGGRVEAGA